MKSKELEYKTDSQSNLKNFYTQLSEITNFHRRNPGQQLELMELEFSRFKLLPESKKERLRRQKLVNSAKYDKSGLTFGHTKLEKEILAKKAQLKNDQPLTMQDIKAEDQQLMLSLLNEKPACFYTAIDEERIKNLFSGVEALGKFVDLNSQYAEFCNLHTKKNDNNGDAQEENIDYIDYLRNFDKFDPSGENFIYRKILEHNKISNKYIVYLESVLGYLKEFVGKTRPLFDLDEFISRAQSEFDESYSKNNTGSNGATNTNTLYCEYCDKQFEKKVTFESHLTGKKHVKAVAKRQQVQDGVGASAHSNKYRMEFLQTQISRITQELLVGTVAKTVSAIERKQALTIQELNKEAEQYLSSPETSDNDNDGVDDEEDDEDSEHIYNPLKLPLGWDGKPIPFWLYKLHGLSVEFNCEICGNYIYRGRKAFDNHFQEARHSYNMKKLGIPNTRTFHDITKIEDAVTLWQKLKKQKTVEVNKFDSFEEFEDSEGNVFNRKTYEDLKRQGLL
ncbi:Pre-mRNA-splicing factor sap61 [Zancudomyces culisetae]|uniref:Pre-mRNA-splicing factor sap61 n=1 Tax=Zancudomyces culisetae TaxID=1213189 RepID=A0A1R1PUH8_ZANCU|nr:Pre-mRNA-splicing factor sap61 [Zancudomyces culisetae]|eukprot:OMH84618.1 Pre-mRNA-splicing factor sap61 [Zancudomyces culisetae]